MRQPGVRATQPGVAGSWGWSPEPRAPGGSLIHTGSLRLPQLSERTPRPVPPCVVTAPPVGGTMGERGRERLG